jgi:hypothetical protein
MSREDRRTLAYDVRGAAADADTVDALARLQLAARRSGYELRLLHASPRLRALIALMGLEDVLPYDGYASGIPNSGNSAAVSRKNVNSTIRPSSTSSTWSAHGS